MKKVLKIILPIIIVLILVWSVLYMMWGGAVSEVEKTEVEEVSEKIVVNDKVELNDMSELSGSYTSQNSSEKITSEIMFNVEGMQTTVGKFRSFQITFHAEEDYTKSSIEVIVDPSSIYTKNSMRDEALVDEGFFEVSKYPEIKFVSNEISLSDTSYVAKGKLFMLGVENELEISFLFNGKGINEAGDEIAIFEGSVLMDRTNFGMSETVSIGNDVKIWFYTELVAKN